MAKNDKNDRSDEVRIVEDVENNAEDVVRLDAPRRVPIERKEAASEDRAMPHMMGDSRMVEEAKAEAVDPETAWLEKEEVSAKSIPFGWFLLLGVAIAGVIFWVMAQNIFPAKSDEVAGTAPAFDERAGIPLGKLEEIDEIERATKHYAAMEETVTRFFAAETIEERSGCVRDVERVLPLMEDYYQRIPLETYEYKETLEYHVVSLENYPFIALKVGLQKGEDVPLLIEDGKDGLKIDWESFVCYQPMDLEAFTEERVTEPTAIRAYVQRDRFYAYDFADEGKFSCYKLTFRGTDVSLFGYVERGTKLDEEFRKLFPSTSPMSLKNPLILELAFLPDSRAPRSVKIHDLLSRLWAYPPAAAMDEESENK